MNLNISYPLTPSRILKLDHDVANQIAAGEVVERPASVVKELLENALDAQASEIRLELDYGGLNLIKMIDDGVGIFSEDLPLAILAHATSKVSQLSDLAHISTMGFRGEALASIASVSKFQLTSRTEFEPNGMRIGYHPHQGWMQKPEPRNRGTTVEVRELFYNAPVRKKFLKSERTEYLACESLVKRFALACPHIGLTLIHNDKVIFKLPRAMSEGSIFARLEKIMGRAFTRNIIPIDVHRAGMRLQGWLGHPEESRSQSDRVWIYLNSRMVRDKLLLHAIKQAYAPWIYEGRHPVCVLYLTIDASDVDVNVHPTKHEVRFSEPRLVHDFICSQIQLQLSPIDEVSSVEKKLVTAQRPLLPTSKLSLERSGGGSVSNAINLDEDLWIPIDHHFALYHQAGKSFLVDMSILYRAWLKEEFQHIQGALAIRPILVPFVFSLSQEQLQHLQTYLGGQQETEEKPWYQILRLYGLVIQLASNQIEVQALPAMMPQLDVALFLKVLGEHLPQYSLKEAILEAFVIANTTHYLTKNFTKHQSLYAYLKANLTKGVSIGIKCVDKKACEAFFDE